MGSFWDDLRYPKSLSLLMLFRNARRMDCTWRVCMYIHMSMFVCINPCLLTFKTCGRNTLERNAKRRKILIFEKRKRKKRASRPFFFPFVLFLSFPFPFAFVHVHLPHSRSAFFHSLTCLRMWCACICVCVFYWVDFLFSSSFALCCLFLCFLHKYVTIEYV